MSELQSDFWKDLWHEFWWNSYLSIKKKPRQKQSGTSLYPDTLSLYIFCPDNPYFSLHFCLKILRGGFCVITIWLQPKVANYSKPSDVTRWPGHLVTSTRDDQAFMSCSYRLILGGWNLWNMEIPMFPLHHLTKSRRNSWRRCFTPKHSWVHSFSQR